MIVASLSFFEGAYQFQIFSRFFICPGNLDVLFSKMVYGNTETATLEHSMSLLTNGWLFLFNFFFNMATMFDICFQTDLFLTNIEPFQKPTNRVRMSILLSFVVGLTISLILLGTGFDYSSPLNLGIMFTFKAVFYICALVNISYSAYLFSKSGISKHYRMTLIKRHLSYCCLTTIC